MGSRRAPGSPGRAAGADPLRPDPQRVRTPESPEGTRWLSPPLRDPKVQRNVAPAAVRGEGSIFFFVFFLHNTKRRQRMSRKTT